MRIPLKGARVLTKPKLYNWILNSISSEQDVYLFEGNKGKKLPTPGDTFPKVRKMFESYPLYICK